MGSETQTQLPVTEKIPVIERVLEYVLFKFRWVFVVFFLLPVNIVYEAYFSVRNWIVFKLNSAPKAHSRKVAVIQKQIADWNKNGRTRKMCTARPGWLTMSFRTPKYKQQLEQIKTNQLVDILEIDKENGTVRVEPMVSMGQLTKYLLPLGYTLPVVPELDDLTVGGLINGCGVESSGRKYGLFQHTCVSYEVVMADGSLVVASKDKAADQSAENQALFYGIPWSHGTLGFLVAATIRIIPCKPYVQLSYVPCNSLETLTKTLEAESNNRENEFVEGLAFSKSTGVVMRGKFSDNPPKNGVINAIGRWYKPWFFTHVKAILDRNEIVTEYIPLRDYYHRHSKSIFWEIQEIIPFGNNWAFRYFVGWASPPKISLLKLTMPKPIKNLYERHHVLQDMLIPLSQLDQAIKVFDREVEIYPVWLCPYNLPSAPGMLRQRSGRNILYVDVGVYGTVTKPDYRPRETTRRLEKFVRSVEGVQMLYADTYMTRAEFWEMFDSSLYEWLRVKYGCKDAFPDVYDKVSKAARD